jgi:ribosome-associated heat shock protein Hsp15
MEDLTPAEEFEKLEMMKQLNQEKRDRGTGRPTKKDRRTIDKIKRG